MTPEPDKPGGYVYVASPYTHPNPAMRELRFLKVAQCCAMMLEEGNVVYSPIVHWHEIAKVFGMPKEHHFWLLADSIMLTGSREVSVLMLDGWEESAGVAREIKFAKLIGKPLTYLHDTWKP
jgi:hypothetical protein